MQLRYCAYLFAIYCFSSASLLLAEGGFFDQINKAHELSHKANESVRLNSIHANCAGFVVPSGRIFDMPEPRLKLEEFIHSIPPSKKKALFDYYFIQMGSDWNSKPSYVWDEWVGFLFGAREELKQLLKAGSPRKTSTELIEFTTYGDHFCKLVATKHPYEQIYKEFCTAMMSESKMVLNALYKVRKKPLPRTFLDRGFR